MEYQKIINFLHNTRNQRTKLWTKNLVKANDASYVVYNTGSQIKFKTSMIRLSLCGYSDAYILVKGIITVENTGTAAACNDKNKEVIFKNCTLFTDYLSEINNKDHARDIDVVMQMYSLIEYSDNYSKTSRML